MIFYENIANCARLGAFATKSRHSEKSQRGNVEFIRVHTRGTEMDLGGGRIRKFNSMTEKMLSKVAANENILCRLPYS